MGHWLHRPAGRRGSAAVTLAGAVAVAVVLAVVLAGHRAQFTAALQVTSGWVLLAAAGLQLVALICRTEAWHNCVHAAGGTLTRRRLFYASGVGNLGTLVNGQLGAAGRIAMLRRSAPRESPRVPALIAAEVPILTVEAMLAALTSYTLVGPLGLPWWLPLAGLALAGLVLVGLGRLASRKRRGFWNGLAVLRSFRGRIRVIAFVLLATFAQIARNWLVLRGLGVDASLFDAVAVLIAIVTIGQLPVGPSNGAAAVVMILGTNGVAAAAAGGVLLTVTGMAGSLCFAAWAVTDRLWRARARAASSGRASVAPARLATSVAALAAAPRSSAWTRRPALDTRLGARGGSAPVPLARPASTRL
jgi:uncharacterized membrane protein YbhN (UPF0104 family)